jgi:hypothetical protein
MICATWAAAASNSELKEREVSFSLSFAPEQVKNSDLRLTLQPVVDVLAHLIPGQAIALLDEALKLLALSADHGQIVIGELPPLLFDPALCLFPISFDAVPIHSRTSLNPDPPREGNDSQLSDRSNSRSALPMKTFVFVLSFQKIFAPIDMATASRRCFSIGQPNVSEIGGEIAHAGRGEKDCAQHREALSRFANDERSRN